MIWWMWNRLSRLGLRIDFEPVGALPVPPRLIWIAGKQRQFVALRVAQVADVEVCSVIWPKPRLSFVCSACVQCGCVERANLGLGVRFKGHHDPVSNRGRLSVEGGFDVEIGECRFFASGDGQGEAEALWSLAQPVSEGGQKCCVEPFGRCDVVGADCDVGNHAGGPFGVDFAIWKNAAYPIR